uniref:G patch domain-containing protein 11 n=1 Tax=Arion vulgaris TaxID=1028688 RepID=A0A0B6Z892_9EUPU
MSSEEEDYMSDAFLQKCGDSRPGLAPKQIQKKYEKEKAQKQANKSNTFIPKHKLEAVHREAGLKSSIGSDSKGFALLQKMGYKPGMGIGKHGTGRVEPVSIELKSGRSGLGRDSEMKRKATEMNNMRAVMAVKRRKADESRKDTFMDRLKERFSYKNLEKDLRTAQKACLQLDQQEGISSPGEAFFWPANSLPSLKESDDEETEEGEELVSKIPLDSRVEDSDDEYSDNGVDDRPASIEFSDFEKLDVLTRYLRNIYYYCIWCGTKYNDTRDLESNCPGNSADAHDG